MVAGWRVSPWGASPYTPPHLPAPALMQVQRPHSLQATGNSHSRGADWDHRARPAAIHRRGGQHAQPAAAAGAFHWPRPGPWVRAHHQHQSCAGGRSYGAALCASGSGRRSGGASFWCWCSCPVASQALWTEKNLICEQCMPIVCRFLCSLAAPQPCAAASHLASLLPAPLCQAVMAALNGNDIPGLLGLDVFAVKLVGCMLSRVARLAVGVEAPMAHLGACVASVMCRCEHSEPAACMPATEREIRLPWRSGTAHLWTCMWMWLGGSCVYILRIALYHCHSKTACKEVQPSEMCGTIEALHWEGSIMS